MVIYVPGTEETDSKKQNMSLQAIAASRASSTDWGLVKVDGTTITATSGVITSIGGGRTLLTSSRNYYVRTDGSDSNTGLANTAGAAFLTIQKGIDTAVQLDGSTYDVTINVAAGTYTTPVVLKNFLGSGTWKILGDATTPANVIISTTSADAISSTSILGTWVVNGFKLQTTTSGYCVSATGPTSYIALHNITFGACGSSHVASFNGAYLQILTNYTVSGNTVDHWLTANTGTINAFSITITISGAPTITYWARAIRGGGCNVFSNTYSGAPAAGTQKYSASMNGWIESGGGTLPGTVAGATATGGQYA